MTPHEDQAQWDKIGAQIDDLDASLVAVPEDSLHAGQAAIILNNVRACKKQWFMVDKVRSRGHKKTPFLVDGTDELTFVKNLTSLLSECFNEQGNVVSVEGFNYNCHTFFALLYDCLVKYGKASGINDLKAFHELLKLAAATAEPRIDFKMALNTLNNRVNEWKRFLQLENSPRRVLFHTISPTEISRSELKCEFAREVRYAQDVERVARKYEILPPDRPINR